MNYISDLDLLCERSTLSHSKMDSNLDSMPCVPINVFKMDSITQYPAQRVVVSAKERLSCTATNWIWTKMGVAIKSQEGEKKKIPAHPFPHQELYPIVSSFESSILHVQCAVTDKRPTYNCVTDFMLNDSQSISFRVIQQTKWRALLMERRMEAERNRTNQILIRQKRRDVVSSHEAWVKY